MATNQYDVGVQKPKDKSDPKQCQMSTEEDIDYSQRGQWLRAAVLGANDGLVSVASLMIGVGAVKKDVKAMILSGFAGLVAGACSMAIGEFVSLPNPIQAAVPLALAFSLGVIVWRHSCGEVLF
ncbi:unnamed protein product [Lactuca saligna]|uniref:Vacuolar iron transporter n=1 Tax=Lactuca saligna TaxID=75948 RepID=A0AA35ZKI9_LACSI|nr:unnamed protein product [Lactuca saligna]